MCINIASTMTTTMKNESKFNKVKIGDMVTYHSDLNGSISQAVVTEVTEKMFTISTFTYWEKPNGIHAFDELQLQFHKSGAKTHHKYLHGNAIEISSSVNIMGA